MLCAYGFDAKPALPALMRYVEREENTDRRATIEKSIEQIEPGLRPAITIVDSDDKPALSRGLLDCMRRFPDLPNAAVAVQSFYNPATVAENLDRVLCTATKRDKVLS